MRYFLIDRVTALEVGARASGIKNITLSEDILHDHFPEFPVLPGALIIEAAAQLAGFLIEMSRGPSANSLPRRAVLVQVDRAKFRDRTGPGDQLEITVSLISQLEKAAQIRAEVEAGGRRISDMDLTFSMQTVEEKAVHEQRRQLYKVWTRDLDLSIPIP